MVNPQKILGTVHIHDVFVPPPFPPRNQLPPLVTLHHSAANVAAVAGTGTARCHLPQGHGTAQQARPRNHKYPLVMANVAIENGYLQ